MLTAALAVGAAGAAPSQHRAGDLDRSFSHDGQVATDLKTGYPRPALDVATDEHDRPVAVGSTYYAFATVRYHEGGGLDRSFSKDGKAELFAGDRREAMATAVAIDRRDRIVVAGGTERHGGTFALEIARYRPSGALDRSFSKNGKRILRLPHSGNEPVSDMAIDDRGRIVVAGSTNRGIVARFHPNGELDRSFGHGGTARFPSAYANAIAIDHGGTIFVTGKGAIFAFDSHGKRDQRFGNSGRVSFPIRYGGPVAVSQGRVAIGGDERGRFAVVVLRKDGERDRSFSANGVELARRIGPRKADPASYVRAIAIDDHQRIDVFGSTLSFESQGDPDGERLSLARFKKRGGLDRSFSDDGVSVVKLKSRAGKPLRYSAATAMAIDSKDQIVGTGQNDAGGGGAGLFQLLRFRGH